MEFTLETGTRSGSVTAILEKPTDAMALLVFAHGAGAGMRHPFMEKAAEILASHRVGTLRYQFPYMEAGRKQPDRPATLEATVKAAVESAPKVAPGLPLFAGGKSMGGRMTSQAASRGLIPTVRGLVFFGFPLHPPRAVGDSRAEHLWRLELPMLFIQGTRDSLVEMTLMTAVAKRLAERATLYVVEGGDHSFHVPRRSGRTDDQVLEEICIRVQGWIAQSL